MENITLMNAILDGKQIAYSSVTEFFVQIGRGDKSGYKTKYKIVGNLPQAMFYYNGINIGNGYKKRLLCPSMNKSVLCRQFS